MTRDAIATDKLAAPVGPFSLGVRGAGLLFLSGQVAQDPATGRLIEPGMWPLRIPGRISGDAPVKRPAVRASTTCSALVSTFRSMSPTPRNWLAR